MGETKKVLTGAALVGTAALPGVLTGGFGLAASGGTSAAAALPGVLTGGFGLAASGGTSAAPSLPPLPAPTLPIPPDSPGATGVPETPDFPGATGVPETPDASVGKEIFSGAFQRMKGDFSEEYLAKNANGNFDVTETLKKNAYNFAKKKRLVDLNENHNENIRVPFTQSSTPPVPHMEMRNAEDELNKLRSRMSF